MFLLIDNYDSFTYNLFHLFGELGVELAVHRNDTLSVEDAMALQPQGIVLSPGPCDPDRAGICLALTERAAPTIPILGVCLGHQTIGQAFGGRVVRAPEPMHGKISLIRHRSSGIFAHVPEPFHATRYHSLAVERDSLPESLMVTAESEDGVIQGLQHRSLPVFGVQFHPESIATEHGRALVETFITIARSERREGNA